MPHISMPTFPSMVPVLQRKGPTTLGFVILFMIYTAVPKRKLLWLTALLHAMA